jgi:hypothetical protein
VIAPQTLQHPRVLLRHDLDRLRSARWRQ